MPKQIQFTSEVWREGDMYVAYSPELDISSCGKTLEESRLRLKESVGLLLEETEKMGTLEELLEESGFKKQDAANWRGPEILTVEKIKLAFS